MNNLEAYEMLCNNLLGFEFIIVYDVKIYSFIKY